MTALRLRAPAKVNWTLEVLGRRPDGYHELRTVLQTVDLCDEVLVAGADGVSLELRGEAAGLEDERSNLALRAAELLRDRASVRAGARIVLTKRIPAASGLGGGSSDAAAVLRGLRELWRVDVGDNDLRRLAAELGSDVPFFLHGGTAFASGRGDEIEPLPELPARRLLLIWPEMRPLGSKTARAYASLGPERYTDGARTARLAERLRAGAPLREDDLYNAFEAASGGDHLFARAAAAGVRPHLCGSGPALYLLDPAEDAAGRLGGAATAVSATTLGSAGALAIEEAG